MADFIDYNQQLLKYKNFLGENFIDASKDPKNGIEPIEITPPNKDGINQNEKNLPEHEKTNLTTPEVREFGSGLDYDTYSVDDLTDEEITTRTIINENGEETQEEIIGPSRQKLRATLAASHNLIMTPGLDYDTYSVNDLIDETAIPPEIDKETGKPVLEKIDAGRQKISSTTTVPENSPNIVSNYNTANKSTQQIFNLDGEEGVYQPVGYGINGVGELIKRAVTPFYHSNKYEKIESNDLSEYKTRTENSITGNQFQMFLYTLVPFVLGQAAEGINALQREISDITGDPTALAGQLGTIKNIFFVTNYLSYFTIKEMASHLLATPFTLGYLASFGFSLKDEISSVKWSRTNLKTKTLAVSWDINNLEKNLISASGQKNIKEMYTEIYSGIFRDFTKKSIREYLTRKNNGGDNTLKQSGILLNYQGILEEFRKEINTIIDNYNKSYKEQKSFFEFGVSDIPVGSENKDPNLEVLIDLNKQFVSKEMSETMIIKPGESGTNNSLISNYKAILDSKSFISTAQKIYSYISGNKSYSADEKRTKKIFDDTMNMIKQEEELLELKRTENLIYEKKYALELSDFLKVFKEIEEERNTEKVSGRDTINAQLTNIKSEHDKNIEKIKSSLKNKSSIGYIYVYPSRTDSFSPFRIPFQFNPVIGESGQAARYDAMNMLHRQGQAFSYIQTEGQTLTLETEYLILSDGKEDENGHDNSKFNNPQDTFYSSWNPKTVQSIELALRSLVLPIAQNNPNEDIMFHKPPMVKIVIGRGDEKNEIDTKNSYNNLYRMLMYPLKDGKYYHKTYIVTKVTITRDAETPYYITDDGTQIVDTHGFKVSMDLTEIDHNYVGVAPDFKVFYDAYRNNSNNFLNIG